METKKCNAPKIITRKSKVENFCKNTYFPKIWKKIQTCPVFFFVDILDSSFLGKSKTKMSEKKRCVKNLFFPKGYEKKYLSIVLKC